jgi:LPS-assembly lipoprotein
MPINFKIQFLILALAFIVSACGFEPVYGVNRNMALGVEDYFGAVEIGNIPDYEGQYLRNALIDRFYRSGRPAGPRYELNISPLDETLIDIDITKTSDATRGQLRMATGFTLKDKVTGEIVLTRSIQAITSYNILASEFSTRVTEDNARKNALDDLARQIELQLGLYFRRTEDSH